MRFSKGFVEFRQVSNTGQRCNEADVSIVWGQKVECFKFPLDHLFSAVSNIAIFTISKSRVAFAALAFRKPHVLTIAEGRNLLPWNAFPVKIDIKLKSSSRQPVTTWAWTLQMLFFEGIAVVVSLCNDCLRQKLTAIFFTLLWKTLKEEWWLSCTTSILSATRAQSYGWAPKGKTSIADVFNWPADPSLRATSFRYLTNFWVTSFIFSKATRFSGTFDEYKQQTEKATNKRVEGMVHNWVCLIFHSAGFLISPLHIIKNLWNERHKGTNQQLNLWQASFMDHNLKLWHNHITNSPHLSRPA